LEVLRARRGGAHRAGKVAATLATLITAAAAICAGILVLHIVFVLSGASPRNAVVSHLNQWAYDLAGPFRTLFSYSNSLHQPNLKVTDTVNYGLAAAAYILVSQLLALLLRRVARYR
jgi:fructose-bisphosphate aldolase class 1